MTFKKRFALFLFQLPITLLVGILLSFAYSMRVDDRPEINWAVAIILAIVLDFAITLLNKRDEKRHRYVQ
jgi:hypothetical protein